MLAAYGVLLRKETYQRARAAANRALEIDERLAGAHASLVRVKTEYEWDWAGAEREYRRAIELDRNYATAHQWFAIHLSAVGRPQEAVAEIQQARDADPLSILYFARRYDRTAEENRKAIALSLLRFAALDQRSAGVVSRSSQTCVPSAGLLDRQGPGHGRGQAHK